MVLCCVCLIDKREPANNAVTYVHGNSVCQEHIPDALPPKRNGAGGVQVLKTVINALAQQQKEAKG